VTTVSPNLRLDVPTDARRGATVPITFLQRTNRGRPVDAGLYSVRGVLLTEEQVPLETPIAQLRISAE
jgi:hypothetical protein